MKRLNLPLKIGVIDDQINLQVLKNLVPYYLEEKSIISCHSIDSESITIKTDLPVNHSTLCTALLIEGLYMKKILNKVQIMNISITNRYGEKTLHALISALDYCNKHDFDILSISVGVLNLLYAKQMIPLLQQGKETIVVAAAANNFSLTYPAAFPTVIGVKRAVHNTKKQLQVVKNPIDGIDLIMSYTDTPLLYRLRREYKLDYQDSNSILVPRVCAEITDIVIQSGTKLTKEDILCFFSKLARSGSFCVNLDYSSKKIQYKNVPIVLFYYNDKNKNDRYHLLKKLQRKFEIKDYSCSILCDFILKSDFENGWYKIYTENIAQEINYYTNMTTDSIIFLLINSKTEESFCYDILINDRILPHSTSKEEIDKLFIRIIDTLS